jgi:hypothetical protein
VKKKRRDDPPRSHAKGTAYATRFLPFSPTGCCSAEAGEASRTEREARPQTMGTQAPVGAAWTEQRQVQRQVQLSFSGRRVVSRRPARFLQR